MPEIEISQTQFKKLATWLSEKGGTIVVDRGVDEERVQVVRLEDEPVVLYKRPGQVSELDEPAVLSHDAFVFCSKKIAKELEEAGIIFEQEQKTTGNTVTIDELERMIRGEIV